MAAPSLGLRSRREKKRAHWIPCTHPSGWPLDFTGPSSGVWQGTSLAGDGEELPGEMKPQHCVYWAYTGPSHNCKLLAGTRHVQAPTNVRT